MSKKELSDIKKELQTQGDQTVIGCMGIIIGLMPMGLACGGAMALYYVFKQHQQGDVSTQFFVVLMLLIVPFIIMAILLAIKCFSIKNAPFKMVDNDIVLQGKLLPTWAMIYYRLLTTPLGLLMCYQGVKTMHIGLISSGATLILWSFYHFFIKKGVDVVSVTALFKKLIGK